jgi:homocysteine S-methyltransferase
VDQPTESETRAVEAPSALIAALRSGFPLSVEVSPPRGANPTKMLQGARLLQEAGVDAVNINDNPMARVRMSNLAAGHLIKQQLGLETILHMTTRDRNLMALQADLLGAHALGVRAILALTGDPSHTGDYALAKGVYDVDSIGLVRILRRLNEGVDVAGNSIGRPTSFLIGIALSPSALNLDLELERFHQKVEAGADFVMTQPVYDPNLFMRVLERIGKLTIPILMGVLPLQSYRHAEFLHNELPGVTLTPETLSRMRDAGAEGQAVGMAMAMEILEGCLHLVNGIYVVPSFQRYEPAAELIRRLRSHMRAAARA